MRVLADLAVADSTRRNPLAARALVAALLVCSSRWAESESPTTTYLPAAKHFTWGTSVMLKKVVLRSGGGGPSRVYLIVRDLVAIFHFGYMNDVSDGMEMMVGDPTGGRVGVSLL